jgi:hypothetical protein
MIITNTRSGSALNECESETLLLKHSEFGAFEQKLRITEIKI